MTTEEAAVFFIKCFAIAFFVLLVLGVPLILAFS